MFSINAFLHFPKGMMSGQSDWTECVFISYVYYNNVEADSDCILSL